MKLRAELKLALPGWKNILKIFFGKIKRRVWNRFPLLYWHKLWIRKNEFHESLDVDFAALLEMSPKKRREYFADIERRRRIACRRDEARQGV